MSGEEQLISAIDYEVAERLRATGQKEAGIDLALANAAIMFHIDRAADELGLAGATDPVGAGRRNADARLLRLRVRPGSGPTLWATAHWLPSCPRTPENARG